MFASTLGYMRAMLQDPPTWPAHGTRRRYRLELSHDGQACDECAAANARYQRQYRAVHPTGQTVRVDGNPGWQQLDLELQL